MNKSITIVVILIHCVLLGCKNTSRQRTDKIDLEITETEQENGKEENDNKILKLTVMKLTDKDWQEIKESYYKIEKSRKDFFDKDESGEEEFDLAGVVNSKDIELGGMILFNDLKQRGYRLLSDSGYIERIKYVYGIDLNSKNLNSNQVRAYNDYAVVLIPTKYYDDQNDMLSKEFYPDRPYVYILKKFRLSIVEMPLVTIVQMNKTTDKDNVIIYNNPFFYHWNNYVLNNNKGSLMWLLNNGYEVELNYLLYYFGFDKEDIINKRILNTNFRRCFDYNHLFAAHDIYGELDIREGLLSTVANLSSKDSTWYYSMLENYIRCCVEAPLVSGDDTQEVLFKEFNADERREIIAHCIPTLQSLYSKYYADGQNAVSPVIPEALHTDPDMLPVWEKNNYYGIEGLSEIVGSVNRDD